MLQNAYSDSVLKIDLNAIKHNYNIIAKQASGAKCAAVVKADAYGLNMLKVTGELHEIGVRDYFVATVDEAIELRGQLFDDNVNIFVLNGFQEGQQEVLVQQRLVPVLNNIEQIELWNKASENHERRVHAILNVNTGMNRLGVSLDNIKKIAQSDYKLLEGIKIEYLMSHLACADQKGSDHNIEQLNKLKEFHKYFKDIPVSFANSYATFLGKKFHFDMVRPGMALYGLNPTPGKKNPMKKVVRLHAKILQVTQIKKGEFVGYNATWKAPKNSIIATLSVGYADGVLRNSSNKACVAIDGIKVPIIGNVSMDLIVVDVSAIPKNSLYYGKDVEIFGDYISLDDFASQSNTIGYELLTSIGQRYKKIYEN